MFTLRSYTEDGERNVTLGRTYHLIRKDINEKTFNSRIVTHYGFDFLDNEDIKALIEADITVPLYKGNTYYVMTEGGKTFAAIEY